MGFKGKRINVVVNGDKQLQKWKDFAKNNGYGKVSPMVRTVVEQAIKKVEKPEKVADQNKLEHNAMFKLLDEIGRRIEFMDMRFAQNNGDDCELRKIEKKILFILANGKKPLDEIDGMLNHHDHDTVVKAIFNIHDMGLLASKTENKDYEFEV